MVLIKGKIKKALGVLISIPIVLSLVSCFGLEEMYDFSFNGADFTCIENPQSNSFMLYVHDQTGVIYIHQSDGGFCCLLKSDGSPYTLEDYTSDCSDSKKFRERDE